MAVEHLGLEAARPYVEAAGATYPVAVDERGVSVERFGFTVVPNGVLVDEGGTVRWTKHGGFSVDDPEDVAAVERFLAGEEPGAAAGTEVPYALLPTERELVAARVRLGQLLMELGRHDEAVAEWRSALRRDPENFLVRKQIWAAEHPEKFHPEIDFGWQQEQLREEREVEVAAGICGPDSCPVPWATGGFPSQSGG
ncbi:MAG: tetratricopeptide repeat protein [Chloroflexia bacterium]|nr:tetratricopeptide repeat protein [Chloroflexia bacterium]